MPGGEAHCDAQHSRSLMGHVHVHDTSVTPGQGLSRLSLPALSLQSRRTLPNLGVLSLCFFCSVVVGDVRRRRPAEEKTREKDSGNEKFWLAPSKSEMGSDNGSKAIEPEVGIIKAVLSTMAAVSQRNRSNHAAVNRVTTHVNPLGSAA